MCESVKAGAGAQPLPVRMFWKASSTLLASRADVSMKDKLFSPAEAVRSLKGCDGMMQLTGKLLGFFCRDCSQMSQVALVSNQHDDNVCIGMIP